MNCLILNLNYYENQCYRLGCLFVFAGCITAQSDKDIVGEEYNQETTLTMNENDLLIQYLKIPSTSGAEKFAGEFFRDVCSQSGFFITQYGEENGNFNFAASLYPLSKQNQI